METLLTLSFRIEDPNQVPKTASENSNTQFTNKVEKKSVPGVVHKDSGVSREKFKANVGIGSWFSQLQQASNLFHIDERVTWVDIEGIPLKVWTKNTFLQIVSKWGDLLHVEDQDEGKVFWFCAKEVSGWIPDFVEDDEEERESDVEEVSETIFENEQSQTHKKDDFNIGQNDIRSEDPFNIYDLLNKKHENIIGGASSDDNMKYPPIFTPMVAIEVHSNAFNEAEIEGGSMLQLMEDLVKVGQTMGYNMERCLAQKAKKDWVKELCVNNKVNFMSLQETKMEIIEIFNIKMCWGNFAFDYVYSSSVGYSDGEWVPNGKKLLIISVYAPQELTEKRCADAFNSFISAAGLEEVPLGGCSFTWCYKSATKMSKLDRFLISKGLMGSCPNILEINLDRYLSNHRPILMRESHFDYGPIPFRFFHYWFEMEGFDKFVERTCNEAHMTYSNAMTKLIKKIKYLKEKIRTWIKVKMDSSKKYKKTLKAELTEIDLLLDQGEGNYDVFNRRMSVSKSLQDLDKLESMEVAQKAKIKWAIEEDKNSKYYHGILSKKKKPACYSRCLGRWYMDRFSTPGAE
ncbi:RNA-directed DNA polymerase, eukaryota [Tanacetum coccineum]